MTVAYKPITERWEVNSHAGTATSADAIKTWLDGLPGGIGASVRVTAGVLERFEDPAWEAVPADAIAAVRTKPPGATTVTWWDSVADFTARYEPLGPFA
jgi:hypothetical protein